MPRPIDPEREREEARIEGERAWRSAMFDAELRGQEDPFKPEVISTIHELEFILKRTKSSVEWLMKMPLAKLWEISDDLEAEAFPE